MHEGPTYLGAASTWLAYPSERRRTNLAASIFSGTFPSLADLAVARQNGVPCLLVPKSWEGYDSPRMDAFVRADPALVKFQNASFLVIFTGAQS
jgi:hypothetical protein